ncbi:MAG: prepilin peptidase [Gemmatimonadetes bacterium]|nr:prepilin peptidase [Gemmatimonadota bacterium]
MIAAAFWTMVFLLGACIGSFLNVCVLRWPAGESVVRPRSRCPRCARPIRWFENIPIASWLALRARCAGCGLPISPRYPAVELLVGLGWLAAGLAYGPGFTAIRVAAFGTILLGIALTDLEHYLIPDGFTVFGLGWVLLTAFAGAVVAGPSPFAGPLDAIVGACVGAGAITIAGWLGEVALKKEAMGFGDATLMAFAGAALGPMRSLLTVFVGATLGAVIFLAIVLPVARARRRAVAGAPATGAAPAGGDDPAAAAGEPPLVPFGVFLAPAALVTLLWGDVLVAWYLRLLVA